jgi:hypothetical protein
LDLANKAIAEVHPNPTQPKTTLKKTEDVTRLNTISEPIKTSNNYGNILHWVFSGILLVALAIITYLLMCNECINFF